MKTIFKLFLVHLVVFSSPGLSVEKHTVSKQFPTLSEIAVYLYGSPKKHKDLAKWNGLTPPYTLQVGKELNLEESATLSREEGLERIREMRDRVLASKLKPKIYIHQSKDLKSFVVTKATPTLSHVAVFLYGRAAEYRNIAAWNNLKSADRIWVGQRLWLKSLSQREVAEAPESNSNKSNTEDGTEVELEAVAVVDDPPTVKTHAKESKNTGTLKPTRDFFVAGKESFKEGNYERALRLFRRNRKVNVEHIPSWLSELETLAELERTDEIYAVVGVLLKKKPELKSLPALQIYLPD